MNPTNNAALQSAIKPGWKTTEGWMHFGTALAGLILASGWLQTAFPTGSPYTQAIGGLMTIISTTTWGAIRGKLKHAIIIAVTAGENDLLTPDVVPAPAVKPESVLS